MEQQTEQRGHFRVVRYFSDFSVGTIEQVIASDLTLSEAEAILEKERGRVPGEDIVVLDQEKTGAEAEVRSFHSNPQVR